MNDAVAQSDCAPHRQDAEAMVERLCAEAFAERRWRVFWFIRRHRAHCVTLCSEALWEARQPADKHPVERVSPFVYAMR